VTGEQEDFVPAMAFRDSISHAQRNRPVQATSFPDVVDAARAAWRATAGHYVARLPTVPGSGKIELRLQSLGKVNLWARASSALAPSPSRTSALSALVYLAHDRKSGYDQAGRLWTSRINPSAGGTHSLRPLLCLLDETGTPHWFRSGGVASDVEEVDVADGGILLKDAANTLQGQRPECALFFLAEPDVLLSRYPLGSSLLWRDAGAMSVTAELLALGLGMGSRTLGLARELDGSDRRVPASAVGAVALSRA
jgi:hypothetical protein